MKKFIKTIAKSALLVAISFGFALAAVNAWDNEYEYKLKKEFDYRYEHRFDEEEDLLNPTYLENIRAQMPKEFRFASWGYPEFDVEDGHCYITDEYQREEEIFNKAIEMWTSAEEAGCSVDFNECLNITKLMYEAAK